MLNFLFRGLTAEPNRAAALFERVTAEARLPHWYVEGKVPDTLDGRFAMLASVTALLLVRLERDGAEGDKVSVALTEQFIDVMEAEHRELGLGDPTLGKKVRKLVGSLARRVDLWRSAAAGETDWSEAARDSVYKGGVAPEALLHTATELQRLRDRFEKARLEALIGGRFE